MYYGIYHLHPETYQLNFLALHSSYQEARKQFRTDVEEYVRSISNSTEAIPTVANPADLKQSKCPAGYYLKVSGHYPDRLNLYEKVKNVTPGRVWGQYESYSINKVRIFSIVSLALAEGISRQELSSAQRKHTSQSLQQHGGHAQYLGELKDMLKKRPAAQVNSNGDLTELVEKAKEQAQNKPEHPTHFRNMWELPPRIPSIDSDSECSDSDSEEEESHMKIPVNTIDSPLSTRSAPLARYAYSENEADEELSTQSEPSVVQLVMPMRFEMIRKYQSENEDGSYSDGDWSD